MSTSWMCECECFILQLKRYSQINGLNACGGWNPIWTCYFVFQFSLVFVLSPSQIRFAFKWHGDDIIWLNDWLDVSITTSVESNQHWDTHNIIYKYLVGVIENGCCYCVFMIYSISQLFALWVCIVFVW